MYGSSLTARATTGAEWEAEKILEKHEQNGGDLESVDVPEMGKQFISSEILEEWVLTPLLLYSDLKLCS